MLGSKCEKVIAVLRVESKRMAQTARKNATIRLSNKGLGFRVSKQLVYIREYAVARGPGACNSVLL